MQTDDDPGFEGAPQNDHVVLWRLHCMDCGVDTVLIGEYYMVDDAIWRSATDETTQDRMLCIGCLEKRLGYMLAVCDFTNAVVNDGAFRTSERLCDRATGTGSV